MALCPIFGTKEFHSSCTWSRHIHVCILKASSVVCVSYLKGGILKEDDAVKEPICSLSLVKCPLMYLRSHCLTFFCALPWLAFQVLCQCTSSVQVNERRTHMVLRKAGLGKKKAKNPLRIISNWISASHYDLQWQMQNKKSISPFFNPI